MRHLHWQIRLVNGLVIGGMLLGWTHSALAQRRPIVSLSTCSISLEC